MSQSLKKLSSLDELQNHIKRLFILEVSEKLDNEGKIESLPNISFLSYMFYLIEFGDFFFAENFYSENIVVLAVLLGDQFHISKSSNTQSLNHMKILNGEFLINHCPVFGFC